MWLPLIWLIWLWVYRREFGRSFGNLDNLGGSGIGFAYGTPMSKLGIRQPTRARLG